MPQIRLDMVISLLDKQQACSTTVAAFLLYSSIENILILIYSLILPSLQIILFIYFIYLARIFFKKIRILLRYIVQQLLRALYKIQLIQFNKRAVTVVEYAYYLSNKEITISNRIYGIECPRLNIRILAGKPIRPKRVVVDLKVG